MLPSVASGLQAGTAVATGRSATARKDAGRDVDAPPAEIHARDGKRAGAETLRLPIGRERRFERIATLPTTSVRLQTMRCG